jgi:uncharacterized cupredoxin-like copper-binding protein
MDSRKQYSLAAVIVVLGTVTLFSGCGENSESEATAEVSPSSPKAEPQQVAATVNDYSVKLDPSQTQSGKVAFRIQNTGEIVHEFVILKTDRAHDALPTKGNAVEEEGIGVVVDEVEDIAAGATAKLTANLKPGNYALICNLPQHYALGMHANLSVR